MSEALCAFPTWFAASSCLANRYVYKENEVFDLTEHHIELLKLLIWCDMKINDGLVDFFFKGYPLPLPYTDGEKVDAESLFRELDKALYVYLRNAVWN
ncbi:hypothetical protein FQR65_LT16582 [Abscondita terminalis]|nr:hypothetical protein FQR65_LT16582 [Abscondita terminalis]